MSGAEAGPEALRLAAASGDRVAQFVVASNYLDDRGRRPDYAAAALWLEKAARQGLAPAEYRLGTLYERGRGTPLDLREASLLYDSAARKGNVRAMHNLAVINTGAGGNADFTVAAYWFGQAASYGLKDSQFNLAILYERGMGVEQNLPQAYFWYSLAARQGDPDARARVDALKDAVKADAAAIAGKVAAFQPRVPDREANAVAVTDPQWRADVPSLPPVPDLPPAAAPQARSSQAQPLTMENAVASAQSMLMRLGFDPGTVDGQMGARTANAIRLFQLEHGLPVNGAVSAELLAALAAKAG
jgi:localization factor PodJL